MENNSHALFDQPESLLFLVCREMSRFEETGLRFKGSTPICLPWRNPLIFRGNLGVLLVLISLSIKDAVFQTRCKDLKCNLHWNVGHVLEKNGRHLLRKIWRIFFHATLMLMHWMPKIGPDCPLLFCLSSVSLAVHLAILKYVIVINLYFYFTISIIYFAWFYFAWIYLHLTKQLTK